MISPTPEQKRELLARLLRERAEQRVAERGKPAARANPHDTLGASPLMPISHEGDLRLSFAQERVWFLEQLQPEDLFYNIMLRVELSGRLDIELLRRSLESVVARHAVLRATFPTVDEMPVQRIAPPSAWPMPVVDLRELAEAVRENQARRLTTEAVKTPFDLTTGPLLRTFLLRLADEESVLVVTVHHIISDGWSLDLFLKETTAFYHAFSTGTAPALPELPVQFPDFAHWQHDWLTGDVHEAFRAYWAEKLSGSIPTLDLPADHRAPENRTYEGRTRNGTIDATVLAALRDLSRREGVTLYTTLLSALKTLLHRYAAQDDVIVGTLISGRLRGEVDALQGFFANTLVLRTDLSGDPTFRELLLRVRDVVLGAHAHADFPYEKMVEELRPERSLGRNPFFQIVFNMIGYRFGTGLSLPGLRIRDLPTLDFHATTEGLTIYAFDQKEKLDFTIVYSPQLFDAETIARFEGHFKTLLAGIVAGPDARLSELPLLSPSERERLLVEFNANATDFPSDGCYPEYFERQVARSPDAIAAEDDDGTLSYAELNTRANRVARTLIEAGVGPDTPVALFAERGRTLLTWIIATLKAGGVYLPLDPRHPAGRHASILLQSKAAVVLVADDLIERINAAIADLPAIRRPTVFRASDLAAQHGDTANPGPRARPDNVAYIIFTSGSTGTPKGAMVPHRAMLNHFWSRIRALGITPADVIAQSAPQGFDISVFQFLGALLAGARVRIASEAVAVEPARMFSLIEREGITGIVIVPSYLRAYLDERPHAEGGPMFGKLRWLVLCGEPLPPDLARQWLSLYPRSQIVNSYGPSECADDVVRHFLLEPPAKGDSHVPIGRPIHNARVYVLDSHLALAPLGVAGEICIGGASVGRGYINDPERTAASFVPDPYSETPGARMYRSGDRARFHNDGTLEFLGRMDHQVKIRGQRIELREIEAVIARNGGVKQAVVNVWAGPLGPRLVAYLVPAEPTNAAIADELRRQLRSVLPGYMVPDSFVLLAALPLSANGKVNRAALPAPESAIATGFVDPRTAAEKTVAKVWADVLGLERVGARDNFFDVGGQSLLATRVVARLREAFRLDLPLRRIFELQTVAELAASIEADLARRGAESLLAPATASGEPALGRVSRERYERTVAQSATTDARKPT